MWIQSFNSYFPYSTQNPLMTPRFPLPSGINGSISTVVLCCKREETENTPGKYGVLFSLSLEWPKASVQKATVQTRIPCLVFDTCTLCLYIALSSPEWSVQTAKGLGRWLTAWIHLSSGIGITESKGFNSRDSKKAAGFTGHSSYPCRQCQRWLLYVHHACPGAACFP